MTLYDPWVTSVTRTERNMRMETIPYAQMVCPTDPLLDHCVMAFPMRIRVRVRVGSLCNVISIIRCRMTQRV